MEIREKGLLAGGISLICYVLLQALRFILSHSFHWTYAFLLCGIALVAIMLLLRKDNHILLKVGLALCVVSQICNLIISINSQLIFTVMPFALTVVFGLLFIRSFIKDFYLQKVLKIYAIAFLFLYFFFEILIYDMVLGYSFLYYQFLSMLLLLLPAISLTFGVLCLCIYATSSKQQVSDRKIKRYSRFSTLGIIGICFLVSGFLFAILLSLLNRSEFAFEYPQLMEMLWVFAMLLIGLGGVGTTFFMASLPYKSQVQQLKNKKFSNSSVS